MAYRRSRRSLHSGESSVSLHASLTSLTRLTFVSTCSSGSLRNKITTQSTIRYIIKTQSPDLNVDLQRDHEDQQGQQHRQDQQDPREEKQIT